MILEQETYEKFGYYPSTLSRGSHKMILAACDKCGKIRMRTKHHYYPLCRSCSKKDKPLSKETREKMSESKLGEKHFRFGKHLSEETKRKISEARKGIYCGENHPWFGRHHSEETKRKISEARTGIYPTEETRQKLSEARTGEKHPQFGKHRSEETKNKLRLKFKGKTYEEIMGEEKAKERKRGISERQKGMKNHQWQGGKSYLPYCSKFNEDLKERVREFFDRKCFVCGKTEKDNGEALSIHHVNYDKMVCCNDVSPLFVPLCGKHHSQTNYARTTWEQYFEKRLMEEYGGKCYFTKEEMAAHKTAGEILIQKEIERGIQTTLFSNFNSLRKFRLPAH